MNQKLEIKPLSDSDREFVRQRLNFHNRILFLLIFFAFVNGFIFSYLLNGFFGVSFGLNEFFSQNYLVVVLGIGFSIVCLATYSLVPKMKKFISIVKIQRANLYSQNRIEGIVQILDKSIITHQSNDSATTYSFEFTFYSDVERIKRRVSIDKIHDKSTFEKIQIGDSMGIVFYTFCDKIKTLVCDQEEIHRAYFKD